jgi:YidC/Oxa1 family membrane protein insertase
MELLYNIFIMPIELLVEITYGLMRRILGNYGLAIIGVSLVVQTLILPLYKRADAIQDEERQRQEHMSYWVRHIKKTFKGDERFMMLSTYYRQQDYKSWYPLKSSIAILLQIPFFIAAYHYLSNLPALSGKSFLFIKDLGEPDSSFFIGKFPINILPIVMTGFNLISSVIYTRGQKIREKIQVYGLAAVFLVLLYNSPSGLVLYWTMNNLYSMMKNVFMKLLVNKIHLPRLDFGRLQRFIGDGYWSKLKNGGVFGSYILEAIFMTFFVGGMVSLNVVNASPTEFMTEEYGPVQLVIHNISVYAGIFLVWGMIFFALMKPFARYVTTVILFGISVASCVDYMGFGTHMGTLSALLTYDDSFSFSRSEKIINCLVVFVVFAVCLFISVKLQTLQRMTMQVLAIGAIMLVIINVISLNTHVAEITTVQENNNKDGDDKIIHLSTSGNNVVVFMLDRAISGYIPFIFNEKFEIKEAFEGFTYYPNTLSFGAYTNFASPAIFGGYEYTPTEMNKRVDESLKDKHDEALCVLPKLFSDEGYNVTVCSPPYAGYMGEAEDLSIYDEIENVSAYDPCGWYTDEALNDIFSLSDYKTFQQNNFFYYSVMKICPIAIQPYMYRNGNYWSQQGSIIYRSFLDSYTTLTHLTDMTVIDDDDNNNVLIMQNSTTHDVTLLKTPEYEPVEGISTSNFLNGEINSHTEYVDGIAMELMNQNQTAHYQSNVASLEELANWFAYIKESGCWDNTRIIVVSDHGRELGQFDYMKLSNGIDVEFYNPLLLVKDFDATEYTVSYDFMTNADVPTLALDGLLENPVNPYTNNPISSDAKNGQLYVTTSGKFNVSENNGNVFDTSDGEWYIVGENIFDVNNWTKVEDME